MTWRPEDIAIENVTTRKLGGPLDVGTQMYRFVTPGSATI
jgi:hypothetical protein